ncbi:bifunctional (p)ppGpp synthetase/guanosine-3',5'-bis(diphosphate) 3'-pyrophosphohydrolase [candidate division KSB1 bacterium]|nr:bifunctional (p)ppGpp synthetase/guanosine-3',5'-bis(diphosphate) 3'-pyrophosphohydrolase [candidate division KSB1 bacterium]
MEEHYVKALERLIRRVKRYSQAVDFKMIKDAFVFSYEAHQEQLRKSGEPYFEHPVEVANLLTELKMDYITIVAALLHDVAEDTGVTIDEVEEHFGNEVANLVNGVTKISGLKFESTEQRQAENFRKMLISMVNDMRVILIKFADRLHNMRTIEYLPEVKRERIALETLDVYAPLAHRLGIGKIRWELEDLAFKVLHPGEYRSIVNKIAEKREERERYIKKISKPIRDELKKANIVAKIQGRPKHFYSIYRKIKQRGVPFEEIYDLLAIRIIVKKVEECYFTLGILHNIFTPVHERFKDYIATPKSNMYQSLHTTVIGPNGKMVEIQIRTQGMHRTSEEGIAAHFRYKEGKVVEDDLDRYLVSLRQILDEAKDPNEFMENLKIDLFHEEVFVFTPKGHLLKLPIGATPIDFAFSVHTDIGYHCIGAKVNGRIVPLNYRLRSGDSVEIITSASQKPNPDWIKIAKTSRARSRIKKWIKESLFEQSLKLGEEIVTRQFKRFNIKPDDSVLEEIAQSYGFSDPTRLFAAIGRGDIPVQGVIRKIAPEKLESEEEDSLFKKFISRARGTAKGVRVQGLDNLLVNFAKCCQPVPGDSILGFITKGRGVVIHRSDCKNILKLMLDPERKIDVEWDVERDRQFLARLKLLGEDRKHFLRDITESISSTDTNIVSIVMNAQDSLVHSIVIIEVRNLNHLIRVMSKISKVEGVISVERLNGASKDIINISTIAR